MRHNTAKIGLQCILLCLVMTAAHADTIDHYINIANSIPQMEMKADPQAQAWARSARNILLLTSESVAESLTLTNESATKLGAPIFCLPPSVSLNGTMMNELIQQTYREISSQQSDKNKMTVSQVALLGISKQYPCQQQAPQAPPMPSNPINPASQVMQASEMPDILR